MPRGCQGAKCETEFELYSEGLTGVGRLGTLFSSSLRVTPRFVVAMNSVARPQDWEEGYRFLPTNRNLVLEFTDFASWFRGREALAQYEGEVRLNPIAGRSVTRFEQVSADQPGFFPAHQHLDLYFSFRLTLPGLFAKPELTIFNKQPMVFRTTEPLTGFPPMDGPDFVSTGPVEMYDVDRPDGAPVGRFGKGRIIPVAAVTYRISARLLETPSGSAYESELLIERTDEVEDVETAILCRAFPGSALVGGDINAREIVTGSGARLPVLLHHENPAAGPPGYFVRVASVDTNFLGYDRADIDVSTLGAEAQPNLRHVSSVDAALATRSVLPTVLRQRAGAQVILPATDIDATTGAVVALHSWIGPHGFRLEPVTEGFAVTLPMVLSVQEVWFTRFTERAGVVDGPHVLRLQIEP